jgi:hypothetical protein
MALETAPIAAGANSRRPSAAVDVVANYDGVGGDFYTACDLFRWAATRYHAFPTKSCTRDVAKGDQVIPIPTESRGPYFVIDYTPPFGRLAPLEPRIGRNADYQIVAMTGARVALRDPTFIQGVECQLPPSQIQLCIQNLNLFLQTSRITTHLPGRIDKEVVTAVRAAIRSRTE